MGRKITVTRIVDTDQLAKIGSLGGKATAAIRTAEERSEIAARGARQRWKRYYALHPERLKAKRAKARKARKAGK